MYCSLNFYLNPTCLPDISSYFTYFFCEGCAPNVANTDSVVGNKLFSFETSNVSYYTFLHNLQIVSKPCHPSFPTRHGISRVYPPFLRSFTWDRRAARRRPHAKLRRLGSSTGGFVVGPFADRMHARLTLLPPLSLSLRRACSAGHRQGRFVRTHGTAG